MPGYQRTSDQKMRLIQLNLNHCRAAQDLLAQSVRELWIDVAVLCEQYQDVDAPG